MELKIKGKSKAEILAALYNNSKSQGFWANMPGAHHTKVMSVEEAQQHLQHNYYFDYLEGRVMKVDLSGDTLDTWGYDRDNGEGAAKKALEGIV